MRALVQRVCRASVSVNSNTISAIDRGLLVFLGVGLNDTPEQAGLLSKKLLRLRLFQDQAGKMNLSLLDVAGELLVVSQFTLYADTAKGNRPSFSKAAPAALARDLYEYFVKACRAEGVRVATGIFQAHMEVSLVNDGPVTLMCYAERY